MQRFFLVAATVLLFFGCTSTPLDYSPGLLDGVSQRKLIIEQVIQEQPPRYAPDEIEVTDTYFKLQKALIKRSRLTGGVTAVPNVSVVYYNSIGDIQLYQKKNWYIVLVMDNNKACRYRAYTLDESKAKKFMDALYSMKESVDSF